MGDGFTLWVVCPHSIELIKKSQLLSYSSRIENDSGDTFLNSEYAKNDGLKFELKKHHFFGEYVRITGNFYTFYKSQCNDGDFTFEDLFNSVKKLIIKYDVNPFTTMVKCFELGVNIHHSQPDEILDWLICMQGVSPSIKTFNGTGNYRRLDRTAYWLKFYNKTLHCNSETEKIRIEIRGQTSRFLKQSGIEFLADILKIEHLKRLKEKLVSLIDMIIMYDYNIDLSSANTKEKELLLKYKDANEWKRLLKNANESHRKKRDRFRELVMKFSGRNLNNEIAEMIQLKSSQLLISSNELENSIIKEIEIWRSDFTDLQV